MKLLRMRFDRFRRCSKKTGRGRRIRRLDFRLWPAGHRLRLDGLLIEPSGKGWFFTCFRIQTRIFRPLFGLPGDQTRRDGREGFFALLGINRNFSPAMGTKTVFKGFHFRQLPVAFGTGKSHVRLFYRVWKILILAAGFRCQAQ